MGDKLVKLKAALEKMSAAELELMEHFVEFLLKAGKSDLAD